MGEREEGGLKARAHLFVRSDRSDDLEALLEERLGNMDREESRSTSEKDLDALEQKQRQRREEGRRRKEV